ncbi:MAG: TfuA-like protein [Desertimonas sp.]
MTTQPVVFVGPSLPVDRVRSILDADVRGPARRGDVAAAARGRPPTIVLLDGLYEREPAVTHKELLWAMQLGITVVGAASMGALRAAELDDFGMVGCGEVYGWFRDGIVDADADVAIAHLPAEYDHRPLTVAVVEVMAGAAQAVADGVVDRATATELVARARDLHYTERTWPAVCDGLPDGRAIARHLAHGIRSVKSRDAERALQLVADGQPQPAQPDWSLAPTIHWRRLCQRMGAHDLARDPPATIVERVADDGRAAEHYFRALAGELAAELALVWGIDFDGAHTRDLLTSGLQLGSRAELDAWAREHDLGPAGVERLAHRQAALDWAIGTFHDDTEAGIVDVLRVLGAYPRPGAAGGAVLP